MNNGNSSINNNNQGGYGYARFPPLPPLHRGSPDQLRSSRPLYGESPSSSLLSGNLPHPQQERFDAAGNSSTFSLPPPDRFGSERPTPFQVPSLDSSAATSHHGAHRNGSSAMSPAPSTAFPSYQRPFVHHPPGPPVRGPGGLPFLGPPPLQQQQQQQPPPQPPIPHGIEDSYRFVSQEQYPPFQHHPQLRQQNQALPPPFPPQSQPGMHFQPQFSQPRQSPSRFPSPPPGLQHPPEHRRGSVALKFSDHQPVPGSPAPAVRNMMYQNQQFSRHHNQDQPPFLLPHSVSQSSQLQYLPPPPGVAPLPAPPGAHSAFSHARLPPLAGASPDPNSAHFHSSNAHLSSLMGPQPGPSALQQSAQEQQAQKPQQKQKVKQRQKPKQNKQSLSQSSLRSVSQSHVQDHFPQQVVPQPHAQPKPQSPPPVFYKSYSHRAQHQEEPVSQPHFPGRHTPPVSSNVSETKPSKNTVRLTKLSSLLSNNDEDETKLAPVHPFSYDMSPVAFHEPKDNDSADKLPQSSSTFGQFPKASPSLSYNPPSLLSSRAPTPGSRNNLSPKPYDQRPLPPLITHENHQQQHAASFQGGPFAAVPYQRPFGEPFSAEQPKFSEPFNSFSSQNVLKEPLFQPRFMVSTPHGPAHMFPQSHLSQLEIMTASMFIEEESRRFAEKQEKLRDEEATLKVRIPIDKNKYTLNKFLEASNNLPDIDQGVANAAHELYLMASKKSLDKRWKTAVLQELNTQYKSIRLNSMYPEMRQKDHMKDLFGKVGTDEDKGASSVAQRGSLLKYKNDKSRSAEITLPNGTQFDKRRSALELKVDEIDSYIDTNKAALYRKRLGYLKKMLRYLNDSSSDNVFSDYDKNKKRSIEPEGNATRKRQKLNKDFENDDYIQLLKEQDANLAEVRDYELKRLKFSIAYAKNKNLKTLIDNVSGTYSQMVATYLNKLDNLGSFFIFQKQMLEYDYSNLDSDIYNINSPISDRLLVGARKFGNLEALSMLDFHNGESSDNTSSNEKHNSSVYGQMGCVAGSGRSSSRIKKRLKNELDITIKNAKLDDRNALEFELENRNLLISILEGYLSLDSKEEFIIISENNFSQYHNNPYFVKKSLRNNTLDFKKLFLNSSKSISKYTSLLQRTGSGVRLNNTGTTTNDSGSEARGSSENESGASASASASTTSRRRVPVRGANSSANAGISGTKESSKNAGNLRNKKLPQWKGLTNEETEHDLLLLSK